ncbi:MAG: DEAD/DEAH box helicase family protein [Phycisphaerales bacterium]|nr:DEAD/DEAH box helicase family protein [Phycisphaerales bacterium]
MESFDKKSLSEADIRTKYITPAILRAGWDKMTQMREEFPLTNGRIFVRGKLHVRGERKFADYVFFHKPGIPIAVVEAKDNNQDVGAGMQQALEYAEMLDVPFVFSSNGDAFLFHDRSGQSGVVEQPLALNAFPSHDELWPRFRAWKGLDKQQTETFTQDYWDDGSNKTPRYYQLKAINRTLEAIAKGQDRILLVMATGTGKTFTAFQIIWRLWKAGTKKRILFLADRNVLVDQTRTNDFKPFGGVMTKVKNRKVDKSYEVYLALYQAITGPEENQKIYKQFSPDFFDLIVIDECHRGSADEDSAWREVLEYFKSATQIGLTATPKETKYISNIDYFGKPVFMYSLKQGIEDGFLAPYTVVRIDLDKDLTGWRPEQGKLDKHGVEIEDRVFNQKDFDRSLVLDKRTELVASKVTEFLKGTDRYDKTIVFCEDIDHAERMRQALVNQNADIASQNRKYVMRITGDNEVGKAELDNFIDPENTYPVIVTTSKLMTTGVDAQTCKLIVLDRVIKSMTEFKQIIGRGTRINEDFKKFSFTIMDFKKATELFADPDFDGDPVQIFEPKPGESPVPPDDPGDDESESPEGEFPDGEFPDDALNPDVPDDFIIDGGPMLPPSGRTKFYVDDVEVTVMAERVQYMGIDGKLITESLKDYSKKKIQADFKSLDDFLKHWSSAEQKQAIVAELRKKGVFFEELANEVGKDFDAFDLICHVAFDQPPLTRRDRAENVRKRNYFTKYGDQVRAVLNALLDKYADEGVEHIEDIDVLRVQPLSTLGTPLEIIKLFGGKAQYLEALRELEQHLYDVA